MGININTLFDLYAFEERKNVQEIEVVEETVETEETE